MRTASMVAEREPDWKRGLYPIRSKISTAGAARWARNGKALFDRDVIA
jgi:hypothetical protein